MASTRGAARWIGRRLLEPKDLMREQPTSGRPTRRYRCFM
jgi:hypothetical protein